MRGKAVKKDSISIDILPPRPNRALRSLLSVALSSRWAKTVYHNYSKNIINQIKIVLDMGYTSHTATVTPLSAKNIYYLLSKNPHSTVCPQSNNINPKTVGASLEAPEKPCPMQSCKSPTKSRRFALIFRSAQREKTGASSDAPTDFTFMLFIYG